MSIKTCVVAVLVAALFPQAFAAIAPGAFLDVQVPPNESNPYRRFTLLPDQRVLATGSGPIYFVNTATRQLELMRSPLFIRWNHTATLLPDGRVLLAGGQVPNRLGTGAGQPMTACEIIDPVAGTTTSTGAFVVSTHGQHTATLLPDGRVLITGGIANPTLQLTNVCEIWNPATGTWSDAGRLVQARAGHHAFLRNDGKVLLLGGTSGIELYDPATMTSQVVASFPYVPGDIAAVKISDGRILIFGGGTPNAPGTIVYAFNPVDNSFAPAGNLTTWRAGGSAVQLLDGRIILLGSFTIRGGRDKGELFDPATGKAVVTQATRGMGESTLLLPDGRVLVEFEIYDPAAEPVFARGDYERNARADIFWHNPVTRDGELWSMNGLSASGQKDFNDLLGGHTLKGAGDFDGGGVHDLISYDNVNQYHISYNPHQFNNGNATRVNRTEFPADWVIAGTADADGDGREDIFWRAPAGVDQMHLWLMDDSGVKASAPFPGVAEPGWVIGAIDDFDGDGKADIFWRHPGRGENYLWFLDGFTVARAGHTTPIADAQYHIGGSGDFNDDGKADLVWRHDAGGHTVLWLMDGLVANGSSIPSLPSNSWRFAYAADFNGDDKSDLFWRNPSNGENAVWLMDGFTVLSSGSIPSVTDPNWTTPAP